MTGQWFGQWAGDTAGEWWGGSEAPPVVVPRYSGAGGWNKNWAKDYGPEKVWVVESAKGVEKRFKSPEAALKAAERSDAVSVTFAGVEVLPDFEWLLGRLEQQEMTAKRLAAELQAIETHARRIAAERDDEEALLLLLH